MLMAFYAKRGVNVCLCICLLLVCGGLWQYVWINQSDFITESKYSESHDVFREHIVRDVEIDRRSLVLAGRELGLEREADKPNRHVMCPGFSGGLGNMIFQYASAYGIAKSVGLDMLVTARSELYQIFDIWSKISTEKKICPKAKIIKERHSGIYDDSLLAVRPDVDYVFDGYLQSWKYFEKYDSEIRKQLRFRGDIEKRALDTLTKQLDMMYGEGNYSSRTIVGVHVRRGNFLKKHEKSYGYKVADKRYIRRALKYFRDRHDDVTFIVCTNDQAWTKANVTGSDVIYIEGNPREVDLAILSSLNHTVITVGTFGWWAAWLANGTTLYYKDFYVQGSKFAREFQPSLIDYVYPGWIGL